MAQEITIARVYLREADKGNRESLMREILKILHDERRVKGVTVFRGIAGFGETGEVTSGDPLHILSSLPLVIEFFDTPENVEPAVLALTRLLPADHIVSWPAKQH
jgi:PII-like signaling protein